MRADEGNTRRHPLSWSCRFLKGLFGISIISLNVKRTSLRALGTAFVFAALAAGASDAPAEKKAGANATVSAL